jgi:hypothetical protein
MPTTISDGVTSVTPNLVTDYSYTRTARTIVHTVLDRSDPDTTLRPVGLRTGSLSMLCATRELASELEALHLAPGPRFLTSDDEPTADMTYLAVGDLGTTYDADGDVWLVTIGYQEVTT